MIIILVKGLSGLVVERALTSLRFSEALYVSLSKAKHIFCTSKESFPLWLKILTEV